MEKTLKKRAEAANALLAAYAVDHGAGLGRVHEEPEDATRFPFQRDRGRIIHTQAFRRLKHKTQVFVAGHGDHYRTRITHTFEVAQVSRDMARTFSLNEDLAEAIALAHDLGHTPFGHAGEEAMRECMEPFEKTFEHNQQSLRVVTLLEDRTRLYPGLNLRREVLEGLIKHATPHDAPEGMAVVHAPSLEAQIVNLADEIAYTAHDTDDGLRAGLFTHADLARGALRARAMELAPVRGTEIRGILVDLLVTDIYTRVPAVLKTHSIRSLVDVYAASEPLVLFSEAMERMLTDLSSFLSDRLYVSSAVQEQAERGRRIVRSLFKAYLAKPPAKVKALQQKTHGALEDGVKDYIAGMTDGYAEEMVAKLSALSRAQHAPLAPPSTSIPSL